VISGPGLVFLSFIFARSLRCVMSPPDHYREFMDDADADSSGLEPGMSFDEIYSLLDAVPAREAGRVEMQLGEGFPLRVAVDEDGFQLAYTLAPRIEE